MAAYSSDEFQLHHTGIKTLVMPYYLHVRVLFQLHHTGIKTVDRTGAARSQEDFNCTIQELKLLWVCANRLPNRHFNCTIQELKLNAGDLEKFKKLNFNCTIQELKLLI